ncbi:MAG TPA: hypothetical protein VF855_10865 [Acidimicrobiales bacterium]
MTKTRQGGRARRWGTTALVVLSSILVLATTVGVWTRMTLLDSERFASTITDPLREPEVAEAIAVKLTALTLDALRVEDRLESLLPDSLDPLAPIVAGGVQQVVTTRVGAFLATGVAVDALAAVIETTHRNVVKVLEGDGVIPGLSIDDTEVRLNLVPLVVLVLDTLQGLPIIPNIDLPPPGQGTPEEQVAALNAALGTNLPATFGQPVMFSSQAVADADATLDAAQRLLVLFKRATFLLVLITLAAIAATIALSPDRARTLLHLGLGSALASLLGLVIINRVEAKIPQIVGEAVDRAAAGTLTESLLSDLIRINRIVVIAGILVAIVAFLTARIRRGDSEATAAFAQRHEGAIGWLIGLASAVVLLVLGLRLTGILVAGVVLAGGFIGLRMLVRHDVGELEAGQGGPRGDGRGGPPPVEASAH